MNQRLRHIWTPILFLVWIGVAVTPAATPEVLAQVEPTVTADSQVTAGPWIPSFDALRENAMDVARGSIPRTPRERRLAVGMSGLLVALVATLDEPAYRQGSVRVTGARDDFVFEATASLARPGEWYGRRDADRFAARTVAGLAVSGLVVQNPELTRTSIRTLESILYTEAIVGFIKSVLNRDRPYVGAEPDPFSGAPGLFSPAHTRLAMPSGHAGRVFSIATVLAHQAGRWYVSIPLYAGAASVSIERVRSGHHWLSDVVVGSAIGYFVGRSVVNRGSTESSRSRFVPVLEDGSIGVAIRL